MRDLIQISNLSLSRGIKNKKEGETGHRRERDANLWGRAREQESAGAEG